MSRQAPPRGLFLPVVTTFDRRGDLDLDAFASNLVAHRADRPAGFVVTGSTGEAALLDDGERLAIVERAVRTAAGDEWVVAGTGGESTRGVIRRTNDAAAAGARAAMVVAPHYFTPAMTPAALETHYQRIADASRIPVILYNIPKYAHFTIPADVVSRLAKHDNVIGIKDSSGDLATLRSYMPAQSPTFSVLTGSGTTALAAMESGALGAVLAVALFAGALTRSLLDAFEAGSAEIAKERQATLAPLASRIVGAMGVAGVKAAMDAVGLRGGAVRSPLLPLNDAERAEVDRLLRAAGEPVAA